MIRSQTLRQACLARHSRVSHTEPRLPSIQITRVEVSIERKSLNEQIEKLRASLKGLSPNDQMIIARQGVYEAEQRIVQSLERDANAAKQALVCAATEFKRLPVASDTKNATENSALLEKAHADLANWIAGVRAVVHGLQDTFAEPVAGKPLGEYFAALGTWRAKKETHRNEYDEAKKPCHPA